MVQINEFAFGSITVVGIHLPVIAYLYLFATTGAAGAAVLAAVYLFLGSLVAAWIRSPDMAGGDDVTAADRAARAAQIVGSGGIRRLAVVAALLLYLHAINRAAQIAVADQGVTASMLLFGQVFWLAAALTAVLRYRRHG